MNKTNEELCLIVKRGAYPTKYYGNPPHCSNCGCSEERHNRAPHSWSGHKGCDFHTENECWGGFDLAPGGTNISTCTHRNGCKPWCTYMDEMVALDAEDEGRHEDAANVRAAADARARQWRENRRQ